jgi:aminotransferase
MVLRYHATMDDVISLGIGEPDFVTPKPILDTGTNELSLPTFEPRGAFYTFPAIDSTGMDDEEFAEALLMEERVAVIPGNAFGAGVNHVRCCYATSYEKIEQALDRIQSFMKRHG